MFRDIDIIGISRHISDGFADNTLIDLFGSPYIIPPKSNEIDVMDFGSKEAILSALSTMSMNGTISNLKTKSYRVGKNLRTNEVILAQDGDIHLVFRRVETGDGFIKDNFNVTPDSWVVVALSNPYFKNKRLQVMNFLSKFIYELRFNQPEVVQEMTVDIRQIETLEEFIGSEFFRKNGGHLGGR